MTRVARVARSPIGLAAALAAAMGGGRASAWAQSGAPTAATTSGTRSVEMGALHHRVSDGYGDWSGAYARLVAPVGRGVWYADAVAQRAFGGRGSYLGVSHRRDLSPTTFASVGVGAGTGAFFFPRTRLDGALGVRWGPSRRVVTSAGATYLRYQRPYEDLAAVVSTAVYAGPAVVEVGLRENRSFPGPVGSRRGFVAVTVTPSPGQTVIVRGGSGTEGYQLRGPSRVAVAFSSRDVGVAWRGRVGAEWGASASVEAYDNAAYRRIGASAGVVRHW